MDYHLTWYKSCLHWDDVQWPWLGSIRQRSRSQDTFKVQSTHACVRTITYVYTVHKMCIYPIIFRLPIKQLVFPIFPFLTSGSVHFWSGSGVLLVFSYLVNNHTVTNSTLFYPVRFFPSKYGKAMLAIPRPTL